MGDVKSIDSLMRYLRDHKSININGSSQKRKLRNLGYYHGYKGYRFIKHKSNPIVYSDFNEIIAVNKLDMELKAMLYPKIMFLETALKNYVLEIVLKESNTSSFNAIYENHLTEYKNYTVGSRNYKSSLSKRLRLRDQVYNTLTREYANQKQVVEHFYHNDLQVPIWAIFEVITLGSFGTFLSCMNTPLKRKISLELKLNQPCDTNGVLTENIVYLLKDLRNSVAHNSVVFDCRFKSNNINNALMRCLESDMSIPNITFETIVDYIIIITYLLKSLGCSKIELSSFVNEFEKSIDEFRGKVPISEYNKILYTDTRNKINLLKNYIKA